MPLSNFGICQKAFEMARYKRMLSRIILKLDIANEHIGTTTIIMFLLA